MIRFTKCPGSSGVEQGIENPCVGGSILPPGTIIFEKAEHSAVYVKNFAHILSKPTLLHYTLPLIIACLIAGTIAQKYIGLYDATKIYFANPVLWLGPVPLPGFPILIALIFLNLAFKLFFKSPWTAANSGNIITHIGAMLLLLGGLFTALFSSEGYLDLTQGDRKSFISDYHKRTVVIYDQNGDIIKEFAHKNLKKYETIEIEGTGLTLEILETCRNCKISARENAAANHLGMAQHMQLTESPASKTDEDNLAGVTLRINNEVYTLLEEIPQNPEVSINNKAYRFVLGREKRQLPFEIELLEFKKDTYQGTEMAKAYSSRVRIYDGDAQWESTISMNAPLRYKGYTLFQSSFAQTPSGEMSVLAVVWNVGRAFPYISGLLMCLGMILHLFMRSRKT